MPVISLAFLIVAGNQGASAFERLAEDVPTTSALAGLRVEETSGAVLEARKDTLHRTRNGLTRVLRCSSPAGTGVIHTLEPDPAGATFVAADNGLFLAGPESDVIIPLPLAASALRARLIGLHLDSRRRLWVAAERAFACVETGTFHTHVFSAADGLPAAPYIGLRAAPGGSLLLLTSEGAYRYRPDQGPEPSVEILDVNGRPYAPGRRIEVPFSGKLTLTLAGDAPGGAHFRVLPNDRSRYRVLSISGNTAVIVDLHPGLRSIPVIALDRDLNRSRTAHVEVHVVWPWLLEPKLVGAAGGLAVGLFLALALWRVKRRGGDRAAHARTAISVFMILTLGLQIVAALEPHVRGWPFIGHAMYTNTHAAGRIVRNQVLEGIAPDGTTFPINGAHLFGSYQLQLIHPLITERERAGPGFLKAYNRLRGEAPIAGVQVVARAFRLTPAGPEILPALVLSRHVTGTGRGEQR